MRLLPKTWALLAITGVLGVANAWTVAPVASPSDLPALPAVTPDDVTRIVISSPIDRIELKRSAFEKGNPKVERWEIIAPLQYPADVAQVRTLIRTFGLGVPMDARLDEGNLKDYQLEDQDAKVVELYTTAETPALQVIVGRTVAPNASFVRLPGSEVVYRAEVGPRQRYDQPAGEWRDRVIIESDAAVDRLSVVNSSGTLVFTKGGEGWLLDGTPADDASVEGLLRILGRLRAGDVHNPAFPGGFEAPLATAEFGEYTIVVGSASTDKVAYIKVSGRDEVFAVSAQVARGLTQPALGFRDRRIFGFKPGSVRELTLSEGSLTVQIVREGEDWIVRQPANTDADDAGVTALADALATLRASGIPADTAFAPSGAELRLGLADGSTLRLEVGQKELDSEARPVLRVRHNARVYWLRASAWTEIQRAFGR